MIKYIYKYIYIIHYNIYIYYLSSILYIINMNFQDFPMQKTRMFRRRSLPRLAKPSYAPSQWVQSLQEFQVRADLWPGQIFSWNPQLGGKIMEKNMENHGNSWKNIVKTGRFSGNFPEIHRIINQSFFLNRSNGGSFHLSTPFWWIHWCFSQWKPPFFQWEHPKHVLEIEETIDWWNGNFKNW